MPITSLEKKFELPLNAFFSKNQKYSWTSNFDLESPFDSAHFLLQGFIEPEDLGEPLSLSEENWKLEIFYHSALFYYLEEIFKTKKLVGSSLLSIYDWSLIAKLILNAKISKHSLLFVRNLGILKLSTTEIIFKGCIKALKEPLIFEKYFKTNADYAFKQGLENLLFFLSVNPNKTDYLITQSFQEKNFKPIIDYFSNGNAKVEINERFIFKENFKEYDFLKKDK